MRVFRCTALFLKRRGAGVTVSEAVLITPLYVAGVVTGRSGHGAFSSHCHARADSGPATPCVRWAICSPLAQWRHPTCSQ